MKIFNRSERYALFALYGSIYPTKSGQNRISKYQQFEHKLSTTELKFPLATYHMKKLENLYSNISINVFAYDEKLVFIPST